MRLYDIEDIARAISYSPICPFMMERDCTDNSKSGECIQCVITYLRELDAISYNRAIDDALNEIRTVKSDIVAKNREEWEAVHERQQEIVFKLEQLKKGAENE